MGDGGSTDDGFDVANVCALSKVLRDNLRTAETRIPRWLVSFTSYIHGFFAAVGFVPISLSFRFSSCSVRD